MLFLGVLLVFSASAFVTSELVHERRAWRYGLGVAVATALPLVMWTAELLPRLAPATTAEWNHPTLLAVAALPFLVVLTRLWLRRRATPLHVPGPDDDPVLRRYLAEKVHRVRKQRQEEELLERGD